MKLPDELYFQRGASPSQPPAGREHAGDPRWVGGQIRLRLQHSADLEEADGRQGDHSRRRREIPISASKRGGKPNTYPTVPFMNESPTAREKARR
ncbi:hypothetical protein ACE10Z_18170 [Bradyrhizobium sp. Pha-3]|uniref:hypothetical protein n=1 Tax=Bradyrhizobium sp. Pha-3 TaxID=208375 RepID=UPI0035D3E42E